MSKIIRAAGAVPAAFLASCTIGGIRVALAPPDAGGGALDVPGLKTALDEMKRFASDTSARLADVEQKSARRGGVGGLEMKSWGQRFIESDEYKAAEGNRDRQGSRFLARVSDTPDEHKNITSVAGSGGALIPVDRRVNDAALMPWNTCTIRDLVAPGTTNSNAVTYPRQVGRTNAAAPVADGDLKPQSDMGFEEVTAVVRTIAHYFLCTRQSLDDAPALAAIIDAEARAGLADQEDAQLLMGNGAQQNLVGLMPGASNFVKQWDTAGYSPLDVLIQAIAQVEAQNWKVDGMVLNAVDWRRLQTIKDTQGRYLGNSPFDADVAQRIWSTPVAATNRMPQGQFLVGPFRTQAQIFDRMGVEVLASTEDSDNFRRNLVTLRAEERLAFTIKRPGAFVKGSLTASLAA